jgi:hypothetical protein
MDSLQAERLHAPRNLPGLDSLALKSDWNYIAGMSESSSLRVADADRERVSEELREHMLAGRLSSEEFEERLGRVYAAKTRADLDAVKGDLPMSPAGVQRALDARRSRLRHRLAQEAGGSASVSLVCVAIWLASGASGSFWPIWVIIFTLLPLVRDGWRLFGPAPDVEAVEARLAARRARRLAHDRRHSGRRDLTR